MKSLKKCFVAAILCTLVCSRAFAEALQLPKEASGKLSSIHSFTQAEYEKTITDQLGKTQEAKMFNDKGELGFLKWQLLSKKKEKGLDFIVSEQQTSFVEENGENLVLKRAHEQLYYDTRFPYSLVKGHVHTENVDLATKQVMSTEDKSLIQKGAGWVQTLTKSDSSKVEVKTLDFKENPNLLASLVHETWARNENRTIGDKLNYQIVDFDDASISENSAQVLKKTIKVEDGKVKNTQLTISLHLPYYVIEEEVALLGRTYVAGTTSTGSTFTIQDLENNFVLNNFQENENEIFDVVSVKQYLDRKSRFKDGKFTFLATLSDKTRSIPESPDQIVSVVDKEKGVYRISLGHGINKAYRLTGNDSLVTKEDSDIPDKWISDIRTAAGAKATQVELLNATLKFVNDNFTYQKDYGNGQNLKQIVKDMHGVCSHISKLTAAILRRLGIRAHLVVGYSRPDFFGGDDGPHAVVEAAIDGKSVLFDPQSSELKPLQNPTGMFFKLNANSFSVDDTFISNLQFENMDLPESAEKELKNKEPSVPPNNHNPVLIEEEAEF